ncbi:hypothetical protein NI17_019995 [Thermobifida halotolerans]|uniref:Uncharacterized protein n=1 Tax=Thermobifida halotolerans TaxID=483545 RepID=A0A399FVL4_9ACTN|nr:hypothetical protein [Thermobifida halotolerans]UOE19017.1 hypothetical protein NI17_019995 [Thermobifida halotolerans]
MNRLLAAGALEARVAARFGIVPTAVGLGVLWTLVLAAVPVEKARALAGVLLFVDTAGFGALFVVALLLFERVEGTRDALAVTPLRTAEGMTARLLLLTALSVLIAFPMLVAAARDRPAELAGVLAPALLGVAVTALLFLTACLAVGARFRGLSGFLLAMPPVVAPLILVPLAYAGGVLHHPVVHAVPTTVGVDLVRLALDPGSVDRHPVVLALAVGYALGWAAVGGVTACRAVAMGPSLPVPPPSPRGVRASGGAVSPRRTSFPVARFARVDLVGSRRDPLLVLLLAAPVLLAAAIRVSFPQAVDIVRVSYGIDLAAHTPAVMATLVLLHVPMMFGVVGGLRAVEDADERVLLVLRVSPLSLWAYLGYRMVVAAAASLLGLVVALPLSGLSPSGWSPGLVVAVVLAALQAPVLVVSLTALAADKVTALVVAKGAGAVLVLVPVVLWALPDWWRLPFLVLPPAWPVLAVPEYAAGAPGPWGCLLGGVLVTAVAVAVLLGRTRRALDVR